jgi:uncharacterized repeat protein (TIGR01451 family)
LVFVAFVLIPHGLAFAQADMRITNLSHSPDPVTLGSGQNISFFISANNSGPSAATGVIMTDTLPAGVTFLSATSSLGSCSQAAGTVTCNIGNMSVFAGVSVTITVAPNTASPSATNAANISANEPDPNPANNSASDAVTILGANADLRISSISHSPDPITLGTGQNLSFFVGLSNSGPSNSTGVTLTDTLPAGVSFVSAVSSQGSCTQAAGTVTCNIGNMNRFTGANITIIVTPATAGVTTDNAAVTGNEPDPNSANNSASDAVTILGANADLRISSISHSPEPITLGTGQNLSFFVSVSNSGPSDSTGVTLTDTLPAGVSFVSAVSSQGSCTQAAGTVTCNIGNINRFTGANITIIVTPATAGVATDNAAVTGNEPDPNPANNSASDAVTILGANADLRISSISHSPEPPRVGQNLSYFVSVSNSGPSDSTGVTLTDTLPAGVSFVSAVSSQGSCTQAAGTVTCNIGNMNRFTSVNITIIVTPTAAGILVNTTSVSGTEPDPNQGNNSARDATTATAGPPASTDADVKITMSHSPDPATLGSDQFVQYSINVSNGGPATATGVSLTDTLPAGMTFVSATVSPVPQGSCGQSAGTVTCALSTLTIFQSATVTIFVTPTTAGTISNSATATATQNDPNPGNNTAADTMAILAAGADVRVTITHSPDRFTTGQDQFLQYFINVNNNGPSPATGVALTDMLPAGVTFGGASVSPATQGTCGLDATTNTVNCNLNTLGRFSSASVTIFVTPSAAGTVTNTVSVSSATPDPNPANNSATDNALVNDVSADVRITAFHSPDPITLGNGQFEQLFLAVNNNGPSPASNVTLTDVLPSSTTFAGISLSPPTQGNCSQDATTNTVTCALNTLGRFAGANVTVFVMPTTAGNISHTPNVTATETDPNPANNSVTDGVTINAANADLRINSMSHSPDPVRVGQSLQYFISVSNSGPSAASSIILTDTLPASFTFNGVSVSPPTQGSCSQSAGTITCNLNTMGSGAGVNITIFATPTATGTVVTNSANVSGLEPDPNPANNSRTDNVTVNAAAAAPVAATSASVAANATTAPRTVAYTVVDVGPLPGGAGGPIINNSGRAVGYSNTAGQAIHAVIYNRGELVDLGTLGRTNSYAFSINSTGQVVGQSETDKNQTHAFLYNDGAMTDLGTLGGDFSAAWGINDAGDVAGSSSLEGGFSHAFLYQNGQMLDLNELIAADSGWVLEMASGFDISGRIVGYGNFSGQQRQFILIPVPAAPAP